MEDNFPETRAFIALFKTKTMSQHYSHYLKEIFTDSNMLKMAKDGHTLTAGPYTFSFDKQYDEFLIETDSYDASCVACDFIRDNNFKMCSRGTMHFSL